ncbi:MAG TPA: HAD family hydrolase, partial [Bacteroidetes bacterium]|nr:HAD family hydrolase [Bacteroidota bacterium]
RLVRFERFLTVIGEYRDPHELSTYYLKELSGIGFLLDGARTLLEDLLDRGHRLCLITNGLKEVQRSRIAAARMEPYFEAIVISDEIGTAKPHAGFFQYAFSAIGHPDKEKVVVVGDSLSSDIQGGNNFGLATCWFNPDGRDNITAHRPDYEIKNLEEILPIVGF